MIRRFYLFVFLVLAYCTYAQENSGFLRFNRMGNVFNSPDGEELSVFVQVDSIRQKSIISINGIPQEIKLKFFIQPDEATEMYHLFNNQHEVIIIESYIPRSTGLSASIVNLTFLRLKNGKIIDAEFCNSFFEGVGTIKITKSKISVKIFKFVKFSSANNAICCVSDFLLNDSFKFEKSGLSYCIDHDSKQKTTDQNCSCNGLITPFVLD